ncbi:MAG: chaperone protein DnaK, partial [Actinoallomurus sp.]|nr:chaperone protein DnaK [Actinoallomurus sp.]
NDAHQAIKEEAPIDRIRSLTAELQQIYQALATTGTTGPAGPAGPAGPGGTQQPPPTGGGTDEDVIDAEFTTDE